MLYLKIASIKDFKKNFFFVVDLIEKKKYDLDLSLKIKRKKEKTIFWGVKK